jgi:hypothetical protein
MWIPKKKNSTEEMQKVHKHDPMHELRLVDYLVAIPGIRGKRDNTVGIKSIT